MSERYQWFRLYAEFAGDPVVQSLAFEDQRHFVVLMCLKCDGTLDRPISPKVRDRIICRGLGLDPVAAAEAKRRLEEVGLITKDWHPSSWDRRQYKSDNSTERVRKYRKNNNSGNVTETAGNGFRNGPETETETDIESAQETRETGRLRNRSRGSRLLQEALPDGWSEFCRRERPDLNPSAVWAGFRDYWVSVPGSKGVKLDWMATWRNWVRNQRNDTRQAVEPTRRFSGAV